MSPYCLTSNIGQPIWPNSHDYSDIRRLYGPSPVAVRMSLVWETRLVYFTGCVSCGSKYRWGLLTNNDLWVNYNALLNHEIYDDPVVFHRPIKVLCAALTQLPERLCEETVKGSTLILGLLTATFPGLRQGANLATLIMGGVSYAIAIR